MTERRYPLRVDEVVLSVSNLDKVLYPEVGFTKGDLIEYYLEVAPVILPHLRNRPVTLKRYPNGVEAEYFYEKNCPRHRPEWFQTIPVWSWGNNRTMHYCTVADRASLAWLANLATIELHTSLSTYPDLERPTALVFDLDPGPPATIVECCRVAGWIRATLAEHDLEVFAKTSGSKGLQLYAPLNSPVAYPDTKGVARGLAAGLEKAHPELVVSDMSKALRPGKVLIDWSQNDQYKTTVNVYALRARARPTVSTPVTWAEVEAAARAGDPSRLVFDYRAALDRVARFGDLFAPVLNMVQRLPGPEHLPRIETPNRAHRSNRSTRSTHRAEGRGAGGPSQAGGEAEK